MAERYCEFIWRMHRLMSIRNVKNHQQKGRSFQCDRTEVAREIKFRGVKVKDGGSDREDFASCEEYCTDDVECMGVQKSVRVAKKLRDRENYTGGEREAAFRNDAFGDEDSHLGNQQAAVETLMSPLGAPSILLIRWNRIR
jgi:hypothetical protein